MKSLQVTRPRELIKKTHTYQPPEDLGRFVQALMTEEVKGNKVKAAALTRVRREKFYYHYRKDPEFREWVSEQCDVFRSHYEPVVGFALMGAIMEKDVMAIRTYYELAGKLKHITKHEGEEPEGRVPRVVNYIAVHVNNVKELNAGSIGSDRHQDIASVPGSPAGEGAI
jgi:hypothetical protein